VLLVAISRTVQYEDDAALLVLLIKTSYHRHYPSTIRIHYHTHHQTRYQEHYQCVLHPSNITLKCRCAVHCARKRVLLGFVESARPNAMHTPKNDDHDDDDLSAYTLPAREVARLKHCSLGTLDRWRRKPLDEPLHLYGRKIRGKWHYRREDVIAHDRRNLTGSSSLGCRPLD
jgi:hypothetical protein